MEFALIPVGAEPHDLEPPGERILHAVRTLEIDYLDNHITATCTVGTAACTLQDSPGILARAGQALYQAKNADRDRWMVAG